MRIDLILKYSEQPSLNLAGLDKEKSLHSANTATQSPNRKLPPP